MDKALELSKKYKTLLGKYKINTPLRLAHFFAQIQAESGLKPISENLNYSAKRLIEIFKSRLDRNKDGILSDAEKAKANEIAGSPQKVGNFVYADRMGNGNESSGEGFKYRGRGFIMITGKNNYRELTKDTGVDYINNPDLLLDEVNSMVSALWFWDKNNLNKYADQDNLDSISDIINIGKITSKYGDANGFKERKEFLIESKKIFGV